MDRGDDKHHADDPEKHQLHWQPAEPASGTGNKKARSRIQKEKYCTTRQLTTGEGTFMGPVQISPLKLQTWTVTVNVTSWVC